MPSPSPLKTALRQASSMAGFKVWAKANPELWGGAKMAAGTLGAALLKPFTFNMAYKQDGYFNDKERGMLITQEMVRQLVSGTLYLGTQLGGWMLSKRLFPGSKDMTHFANAFVGSSVIDIVARPFLMAKVSHWLPKNTFDHSHFKPEAPHSKKSQPKKAVSHQFRSLAASPLQAPSLPVLPPPAYTQLSRFRGAVAHRPARRVPLAYSPYSAYFQQPAIRPSYMTGSLAPFK